MKKDSAITLVIFLGLRLITGNVCALQPVEIRPGVYVTDEVGELPLPTSGYDLYVIGEGQHLVQEIHQSFLDYLKRLHKTAGVKDVVLEAPRSDQEIITMYTQGDSNTLPYEYWSFTKILSEIRTMNKALSDEAKIQVHLVDIDHSIPAVHEHLLALQEEIGSAAESISVPPLEEFEKLSKKRAAALLDQLAAVAEDESTRLGLATVRASLEKIFSGQRIWVSLREQAISENIQYVVKKAQNPVIALFGSWHTLKCAALASQRFRETWVQYLTASGTSVYSLYVNFVSGDVWNFGLDEKVFFYYDPGQIQFADGTTVKDVFEEVQDTNIVYIDFRVEANATTRLNAKYEDQFKDIPAGEIFDGLIMFETITLLWPGEILKEADALFVKGIQSFKEGQYETAFTFFEKAEKKYESVDCEKVKECDEWMKKIEAEQGVCMGTMLLVVMTVLQGLYKIRTFFSE